MATLTNTKIKDTYVGLLKTTDNQAIDASGVTLVEDGAGNASALSVGRSGNGVTITGNVGLGTTPSFAGGSGLEIERAGIATLRLQDTSNVANAELQSGEYGLHIRVGGNGSTGDLFNVSSSGTSRLLIDNSGNVGIGTSSPSEKLTIDSGYVLIKDNAYDEYFLSKTRSDGSQLVGFQSHSLGALSIHANGGEKMRIDRDGNVGIGTSTATSDVHLQRNVNGDVDLRIQNANAGSSATATLNVDASGNNFAIINYPDADTSNANRTDFKSTAGGSYFTFSTAATERMRIDSSGRVGIGTTPSQKLDILNNDNIEGLRIENTNASYSSTGLLINNTASTGGELFRLRSLGVNRFIVDGSGNVLIGTTGVPNGTSVYGAGLIPTTNDRVTLRLATSTTGTASEILFYNPNGIVGSIATSGSSTAYNTSSDYRLKENVVEMTGALDRVDALKPSRFNFIADPETTVDGFLAHEVAEIVPEAVTGEKDGMRDEEYEVSPAVYEDVVHPAVEAVYETIEHPAIPEEVDEEGNVIVAGQEAYTEQVLVSEAKEEWTERVLVSEAVMGTRSVPDYQGIDQSKIVPLLVGAIKELSAKVATLESQINA